MSGQMKRKKSERRGRLFADFGVQGQLLKHVFLHWIGFLLGTAAILVLIEMLSGTPGGLGRVRRMHAPTLVAIIMLAPIFIVDMIRFSHRFVGPVVRLRREMKDLAEGKINSPLEFRDGDYWHDLADDFNAIAKQLAESKRVAKNVESEASLTPETETGELLHS